MGATFSLLVPQDACILWKCNKANHQDLRQNKPILSVSEQQDNQSSCEEPLESKWIPVLPGVISQKYIYSLTGGWFLVVLIVVFFRGVNESKRLQSPF